MVTQGKIIVLGAIAGLFVLMGSIVYYASLDNPILEQAEIQLTKIELLSIDSALNQAKLKTEFTIHNPTEKTFTIPIISYELFVNGKSLGTGSYSTEDISMPGRAAFFPNSTIPLPSIFYITLDDNNTQEYNQIIDEDPTEFSVKGMVTIETAWTLVEKNFEDTLKR